MSYYIHIDTDTFFLDIFLGSYFVLFFLFFRKKLMSEFEFSLELSCVFNDSYLSFLCIEKIFLLAFLHPLKINFVRYMSYARYICIL